MKMENCNLKNGENFTFCKIPEVMKISEILRKETNIQLMLYNTFFDDGSFFDLTTKKDWVDYYYKKYFETTNNVVSDRLKTGINYWRNSSGEALSHVMEDARDNFDIDARLDFIYRDEYNKCFYAYSFCTEKKYADKVYAFYGHHMSKLFKFIPYFNKEAYNLIIEARKPENRITIPEYRPISLKNATAPRNYAEELRRENASFEPTSREFEVMLLYAHGLSRPQIAKILYKELSTIETHIDNIRNKSNLTDRFSMLMYLKDRGEDIAINFFFPYTKSSKE